MQIGIDLMGGESPPVVLFNAVELALEGFPQINATVFVTQAALDDILLKFSKFCAVHKSHLEFFVVNDVIEMDDEPLLAIRQKKNSSLLNGFKLLKKRVLDGFVSGGNTGALIAGAAILLPRLSGIARPALLAMLPTERGAVAIIDVGGNVSCRARHLAQFALFGAAYQRCCLGIKHPRVGLLNIGVESKKGTSEVRQAYEILQKIGEQGGMQFIGNIEGGQVFHGVVDVLVTDGFTGNVLLKTSEGVSSFILQQLHKALKDTLTTQNQSILHSLQHQFDYEEYNGAIICGIDRVAVKCHGKSSPKGFFNGIKTAIQLVQNDYTKQIKQQMTYFA